MAKFLEKHQLVEQSINKKFRKEIWNRFIEGVKNYKLIQENDRIAVCISGGKDSMLLAILMRMLKRYSEINFDLEYIVMNPGYNKANIEKIENNAKILNIPINVFTTDIFSVVDKTVESPCYLCARMRRGHLYAKAKELGCNKIALGHHLSDVIETTLMGMMYGSQIQGMLPRLKSTNFEGMELIRPMYCILENDIIHWAKYNELSFLACACKLTERAAIDEDASKRREIKSLIKDLKIKNPDIEKNLFNSIHRCNVDTLVGYKLGDEMHSFLERFETK